MIKSKILYALLIFGVALSAILYDDYFLVMLCIFTLVFPIILFAIIAIIRWKIKIELVSENSIGNKGEKVYFDVIIKNNSIFPISNCEIRLKYHNSFNNNVEREYIVIPAEGKSIQKMTCNIISKHCGNIELYVDRIKIFDYIKLFSIRKKVNSRVNLSILPQIHKIDALLSYSESEASSESQDFSKTKSGDDPSEVFDIRGYKAGDKMQRIHWKLSSKHEELMVKEFSLPLISDGIIFVELFSDLKSLKLLDSIIEATISISYYLLGNNYFHYIAWFDNEKDQFYKFKIDSEEELFSTINLIMGTKPYNDRTYTLHCYNSLCDNMKYSHMFYISPNLSKDDLEEIHNLGEGLTMFYIDECIEKKENAYLNSLLETGIDVITINTENIKDNINKLAI